MKIFIQAIINIIKAIDDEIVRIILSLFHLLSKDVLFNFISSKDDEFNWNFSSELFNGMLPPKVTAIPPNK
jgi:hypothetical protein